MTPAHKKGDKISLQAEKREVFGKKLDSIRSSGKLPANVFGKDFPSTAITVDKKEALHTFHVAGETQVIYIRLDKDEIPVLIADYHTHPVTDEFLHVDFRKVNLKVKTEAEVPVVIIGEAAAVAHKKGDLMHVLDTLTVEALPADIPSEIEIDVTSLAEVDDAIRVSDIKLAGNVVIQDDPETVVVKIAEHKEEDLEPATAGDTETSAEEKTESSSGGEDSATTEGSSEE